MRSTSVDIRGRRPDIDEPLTAVRRDPDAQADARIDVYALIHPLRPAAVNEAVATLIQPRPGGHEELPLLIKSAHMLSLAGSTKGHDRAVTERAPMTPAI